MSSLQLTQRETDASRARAGWIHRGPFRLVAEHWGRTQAGGCCACPGPKWGASMTGVMTERTLMEPVAYAGFLGPWTGPAPCQDRHSIILPASWVGTSAGAESNSCSSFQRTGAKRQRAGALWKPRHPVSEPRGASRPKSIPLLERLPTSSLGE